MARFTMDDGKIVDTEAARQHWDEGARWNGRNHISVNTGSQWEHETLYLSKKGRYYLVYESQWEGSTPSAKFIDKEEAAAWLIRNNNELPEDLAKYAESIVE